MLDLIQDLEDEHVEMKRMLKEVLSVSNSKLIDLNKLRQDCKKLHDLWNVHEAEEDHIFNHMNYKGFPETKSILEQHMQFKGHWKILNDALKVGNEVEIRIAFDTDGQMLIQKFIDHMSLEEAYFKRLRNK